MELPDDVLCIIFNHVDDVADILNLRLACRDWFTALPVQYTIISPNGAMNILDIAHSDRPESTKPYMKISMVGPITLFREWHIAEYQNASCLTSYTNDVDVCLQPITENTIYQTMEELDLINRLFARDNAACIAMFGRRIFRERTVEDSILDTKFSRLLYLNTYGPHHGSETLPDNMVYMHPDKTAVGPFFSLRDILRYFEIESIVGLFESSLSVEEFYGGGGTSVVVSLDQVWTDRLTALDLPD